MKLKTPNILSFLLLLLEMVSQSQEREKTSFTNPDPWARIVGSRNTAAIYINGKATTALYDSGAELQLMS